MSIVGEYTEDLPAEFQKPQYQWWRKALARNRLPIHDSELRSGLYRWGNKAVAIWQTGGEGKGKAKIETHVTYNGIEQFIESRADDNPLDNWPRISKEPVTPQAYMICRDAGWKWPNTYAAPATNAPPDDASVELLQGKLDELEREAKRLLDQGAAKTQAEVDEAARVADLIAAVGKAAVDRHKLEKEPHLQAGRMVDRIWFPVRDRADEVKRQLKAVIITPFLRADEIRRVKESMGMIQAGIEPSAITDIAAKASGGTRTTALRTITSAEITDYTALWTALKDHPRVQEAIAGVANASAKAGVELPGMKIVKTRSAV